MRYIKLILILAMLPIFVAKAQTHNNKPYYRDRVVVAKGDKQFAPFEFINDNGEPDGFSVELFQTLMKRLGIQYTLALEDWDDVQSELNNKEIDLAIGMIYSRERAEQVKFGIPHCMISYNIICRRDNDFINLEDLAGREIIVQNLDRAHEYILETGLTNKIITVGNIEDGVKLLSSGRGDAVISFDVSSFYFVREGNYKNLIVHLTDIDPERYSIVVNTDNEELLYLLNAAMYQMKIDGEYDKIYYKWFGVYEKTKVSKVIWVILVLLALSLIIFAVFIRLLRIKVNDSTRDLKLKNEETLKLVTELRTENQIRLEVEKNLIEAKEKAEESDRLKSAFLANISHEIRTPLNAIIGFSAIVCDTEDREERARFYQIIDKNNELLLQLISDVLDLSKIELGVMIMNYSEFNLTELCQQIAVSVGTSSEQKQIKFEQQLDCECTLYSDKARVMQVIINFITNAIKFTPDGGTIILGASMVGKSNVEIWVTDTGIGIDKENQQAIFERFVKLDSFSQGTGLGLSICKNIIEKLNGQIGVESELGKGSRFWIKLMCNNG